MYDIQKQIYTKTLLINQQHILLLIKLEPTTAFIV